MAVYEVKPARPAPKEKTHIFLWIKKNFLSSPLDIVLTILGILFLVWLIPPIISWAFVHATFEGTTKADYTGTGACWIFIREKLSLFIYGLYPDAQIWRPDIAFVLFFVVAGAFKYLKANFWTKAIMVVLYPIIVYILLEGGYFGLKVVSASHWGGLLLTLVVASSGIVISFIIGIILAFGRKSELPIIKKLSITYIELIRGVPLITILFMAQVIAPLFFPEGVGIPKLTRAILAIGLFYSAYVAECIRGGLQSIPKGQYEAADSLGLTYWKKMALVILPQALKVSIPNLVGTFICLLQDTTLVLIVGLFDFLGIIHLAGSDANWLGFDTEGYVFVAVVFWIFCFSLSRYSKVLENRFNTNNKS